MKKTLLATALFGAFAISAHAQSSVTLYGLIDTGIVAQSVLHMANLPLEANVLFHTVMATKMPFVGRG